jgi:hypothetical protein
MYVGVKALCDVKFFSLVSVKRKGSKSKRLSKFPGIIVHADKNIRFFYNMFCAKKSVHVNLVL